MLAGPAGADRDNWEVVRGATQYLTEPAVRQTMHYLGGAAPGSGLVFTFVRKDFRNGQAMFGAKAAYPDFVVNRWLWRFGCTPSRPPGSSPITDGANASMRARRVYGWFTLNPWTEGQRIRD